MPDDFVIPEHPEDWGVGAPVEKTAAERVAETKHEYIDAELAFNRDTQEALALLAHAVAQLGGVLLIAPEALYNRYRLGIDVKYHLETGGMRVYVLPEQDS